MSEEVLGRAMELGGGGQVELGRVVVTTRHNRL
jgi:hypothetical protein